MLFQIFQTTRWGFFAEDHRISGSCIDAWQQLEMGLDLLRQFGIVLTCGWIYRCLYLWDSTLWILNQSSFRNFWFSCKYFIKHLFTMQKFKELFFSLSTHVDLLIHIIPVSLGAMGHSDRWCPTFPVNVF